MSELIHRRSGDPSRSQRLGPYEIEALLERTEARAGTVYRVRIAPGQTTAVSYHRLAEEYYFVLAGSGLAVLDGAERPLATGDFLRLPAGTTHGFVAGPDGLDMLDIHTPGCWPDHDTYFVDGAPPGFSSGEGR
jgi:quercetin dioxygenase-like cupin family protein